MIVYIESNFVLEVALLQEEHASCEAIVGLCTAGSARLVVPAFSLVEPYESLTRRHRDRSALRDALSRELRQLARTQLYHARTGAMFDVTSLLAESTEEEKARLHSTIVRLLNVAETIPLDARIIRMALQYQTQCDLSPQDAVIYASVICHLEARTPECACFLNKNVKDFGSPDIIATLDGYRCKLLPRFESGLGFIRSQIAGQP
jgi:predicted nucleic acid-binding protein